MGISYGTAQRLRKNEKVADFISEMLGHCADNDFTISDMKDLANLLPYEINEVLTANEENAKFTYSTH